MKTALIKSSLLFILIIIFNSCQLADNTLEKKKSEPAISQDQYVFGHLGSFIMNPDCLFKFENNMLYTTHWQASIDVNNPPAFYQINTSDSIKMALTNLFSKIPSSLMSNATHQVGSYFPDVGYTYVQIQNQDQKLYWSIQANTPSDVTPFVSQLLKIMRKIE